MYAADRLKYVLLKFRNHKINREFKKNNSNVKLPPDYSMFETFRLNYKKYYEGGKSDAQWLKGQFVDHIELKNKRILDWGCGPARIIRHLPKIINANCEFYGVDYNKETINWCNNNIESVVFKHNQIIPPLDFESNFFDIIYGISVFTHLSEDNHKKWYKELIRITKKDGIILLTTQGEEYKAKMTKSEIKAFEKGNLVNRGNVKEGHRVYVAFHPEIYMRKLFESKAVVLKFTKGKPRNWGIEQDCWILRKK